MRHQPLDIVILGRPTTYRGLVRELERRGHRVLCLQRDQPGYADNRDLPEPPFGCTEVYASLEELQDRFAAAVRRADLVIVGSHVPEGGRVGHWVTRTAAGATAFYDIDTPATLAKLARGDHEYLTPELVPLYHAYFSFTGGPTLKVLERRYGSPMARALYGSFDPCLYQPEEIEPRWDLGYMGTYRDDRQPAHRRPPRRGAGGPRPAPPGAPGGLKGDPMPSKRELIDTGKDKRYVRRDEKGRFKEVVDVGKSLAQDRRTHAKTVAPKGQGDRGDRAK